MAHHGSKRKGFAGLEIAQDDTEGAGRGHGLEFHIQPRLATLIDIETADMLHLKTD